MKKFLKIGAVLTALVLGLACFVACSNGDDDGSSDNGGNVSNNNGGNTNNGGNSNEEEEKPRVTVVAEWRTQNGVLSYIFYSDETYECLNRTTVIEKGKYYGISPKQKGTLTILVTEEYDDNAGTRIPQTRNYEVDIRKDNDGDLYLVDDCYNYYYLKNN